MSEAHINQTLHQGGSGQGGSSSLFEESHNIDVDVRDLFLTLWRRKMVIMGILIIGLVLAMVALSFITPKYTARALVLIEAETGLPQSEELRALISNIRLDSTFILSEIEVIRSRTTARNVVNRLNLMNDPEFNRYLAQMAMQKADDADNPLQDASKAVFKNLNLYNEGIKNLPAEYIEIQEEDVITRFLENLQVRSVPGSNAVQIQYQSTDPKKAALIANTVADVFIEQRLEEKFSATQKLTDWLDKRLKDLREQVRNAEAEVQRYKAKQDLMEGARTVASVEQLSQLNAELVQAKAKTAEAEARLSQVRNLSKNPEKIETVAEIVNSPLIQNFKRDEARMAQQLADLSQRYGERHPDIIKLREELSDLRAVMLDEMQKIASSLEHELRVARAREMALEEGIAEIENVRLKEDVAMIRLRELEREAASSRLIFDKFLATYKRSDDQEELQEAEARIISYAAVPTSPSYPDRLLLLSLSSAISLFIGLGFAFLLEKLDNSFRSANQLERTVGYPCYALIPSVENMPQKDVVNFILKRPSSTVAEAVRTLRMVLNLRPPKSGIKPKVVTITSSFPGEGKTTLSCWIGRLAAKSGEKVIVIDGDLRRPTVHRAMGRGNDTSIVDFLTGKLSLDDIIQTDDPSGVHVICAKSVPNSALDLISSDRMSKLVDSLKQVYDLVIIDSPACLAVSDARVLAKLSDQTVYAVAWDRTPREVVMGGVKQFTDMGYDPLAFVLTNVDVKRHVKYGYGDTIYYYGRYKEYYTE